MKCKCYVAFLVRVNYKGKWRVFCDQCYKEHETAPHLMEILPKAKIKDEKAFEEKIKNIAVD